MKKSTLYKMPLNISIVSVLGLLIAGVFSKSSFLQSVCVVLLIFLTVLVILLTINLVLDLWIKGEEMRERGE